MRIYTTRFVPSVAINVAAVQRPTLERRDSAVGNEDGFGCFSLMKMAVKIGQLISLATEQRGDTQLFQLVGEEFSN